MPHPSPAVVVVDESLQQPCSALQPQLYSLPAQPFPIRCLPVTPLMEGIDVRATPSKILGKLEFLVKPRKIGYNKLAKTLNILEAWQISPFLAQICARWSAWHRTISALLRFTRAREADPLFFSRGRERR